MTAQRMSATTYHFRILYALRLAHLGGEHLVPARCWSGYLQVFLVNAVSLWARRFSKSQRCAGGYTRQAGFFSDKHRHPGVGHAGYVAAAGVQAKLLFFILTSLVLGWLHILFRSRGSVVVDALKATGFDGRSTSFLPAGRWLLEQQC